MTCRPFLVAALAAALAGCNSEIYVRDGVTDGDTFYLAEWALHDDDPAVQSWVSYSLTKSTCQLMLGGDNPARATSFECELAAREHLALTWAEIGGGAADAYLDALENVRDAGYLDEYVWKFFHRSSWSEPQGLEHGSFDDWRRRHLRGHEPETRLIGSWGYARPPRDGTPPGAVTGVNP